MKHVVWVSATGTSEQRGSIYSLTLLEDNSRTFEKEHGAFPRKEQMAAGWWSGFRSARAHPRKILKKKEDPPHPRQTPGKDKVGGRQGGVAGLGSSRLLSVACLVCLIGTRQELATSPQVRDALSSLSSLSSSLCSCVTRVTLLLQILESVGVWGDLQNP